MSDAKRASPRNDPPRVSADVGCQPLPALARPDLGCDTLVWCGPMSSSDSAAVLVSLRRIIRFLRLAEREAEAAYGLSAAQLFVLHCLAEAPASSLAQLAERTLTDQSSVSIVVSRLEAKRLLSRKPSREDRRRIELKLTAAGRQIVAAGPSVPQPRLIAAIDALPAARRAEIVRALEQLSLAIGAGETEPLMLFEEPAPPGHASPGRRPAPRRRRRPRSRPRARPTAPRRRRRAARDR